MAHLRARRCTEPYKKEHVGGGQRQVPAAMDRRLLLGVGALSASQRRRCVALVRRCVWGRSLAGGLGWACETGSEASTVSPPRSMKEWASRLPPESLPQSFTGSGEGRDAREGEVRREM